jgi:hypothetical protein
LERGEHKKFAQSKEENPMKQTIMSMNAAANAISVTYSYFPTLERSAETLAVSTQFPLGFSVPEESLFLRQGDYWVIRYQEQVAFLKATRGLHCLSLLLHHPGREFHVSELVGLVIGKPLVLATNGHEIGPWRGDLLPDAGPVLDAKARAEYKQRLDDLRKDLEEAERFNDLTRAECARNEMNALAEQLALAVGLGGRDRKLGSQAERARCAVTKRIKGAINKIGETIPSLRTHLADRVKTGYFCSYSPHADRPVRWNF